MITQPQFSELVPGELTLDCQDRDLWQLQLETGLVGLIDRSPARARVMGRPGSWQVMRRRRGRELVFGPAQADRATASFSPRLVLPGGSLDLAEGRRFRLRPPGVTGKAWKLKDAEGRELTRIVIASKGTPVSAWNIPLDALAVSEPDCLLIVLAACYVVVVDQGQRPLSSG